MTYLPEGERRSPILGDLRLPSGDRTGTEFANVDPDQRVAMLIELNVRYPGGLAAVRTDFYALWESFVEEAGGWWPEELSSPNTVQPPTPPGLTLVAPKLYQCVLSRAVLHRLVEQDQKVATRADRPTVVFRVWPDYPIYPQIDRSSPTVKADAAWRSYDARGRGIVWAVVDSGVDGSHPHFSKLELADEANAPGAAQGLTSGLHRDFSFLVDPPADGSPRAEASAPLCDAAGHGTHVAGIIAGCCPDGANPRIADSKSPTDGGFAMRKHTGALSGMAPSCELVSLKVMRKSSQGTWVTSSSAVIRALTYLRTEVNVDPELLRVHGVNMSLGCEWRPEWYAAGQSPLCQTVNQLVASGVVVVVSAGNFGARTAFGDSQNTSAILGSITEPAHAEQCIAVGSTHRDAPHTFGVTWTSGKGPTLDGRMKPDVVAPGEWIASAATGEVRSAAGLDPPAQGQPSVEGPAAPDPLLTYAEQSGTSMAAPHVSGIIAAFLSARPEFIGRPSHVKALLTNTATDLGRERYAQGAGLVDLMRMLSNV